MAVLFAEGFTGAPVTTGLTAGASWEWGPNNNIVSLGWQLNARYNGTNGAISLTDNNIIAAVEPDPVFGDRRQLRLSKNLTGSVITLAEQVIQPIPDASKFQKIVVGMTAMFTTTNAAHNSTFLIIGGTTLFTSSTGSYPGTDNLVQINFGANDTAYAYFTQSGAGGATVLPTVKRGQFFHFEALIEKDVNRTRIYIDGELKADYAYAMQFNGLGLTQLITSGATGVHDCKFSNIYVLGLDTLHTGKLGPATRVMEVAPPGDMEVQWQRPDSYATNANVLAQMFGKPSPDFLAAKNVGDYDVYNAPSAVAANAAQVYGAGIRINAMTMAAGTHTIKGMVKPASSSATEVGSEFTLQLGALKPYFVDVSVNPVTNALWTPSEVTVAGFGVKLKS